MFLGLELNGITTLDFASLPLALYYSHDSLSEKILGYTCRLHVHEHADNVKFY